MIVHETATHYMTVCYTAIKESRQSLEIVTIKGHSVTL